MPGIALGAVTSVPRAGSTEVWAPLSLPSSSGPFSSGDKSEVLVIQILPSPPLAFLPAQLDLVLTPSISPDSPTSNLIINDLTAWGNSTTEIGPNVAINAVVDGSPMLFGLNTAGMNLTDLNAGNYYAHGGFKSLLVTDPTAVITILPNGTYVVDGGAAVPWAGAGPWGNAVGGAVSAISSGTATVHAVSADAIVYVDVTSTDITVSLPGIGDSVHNVQSGTDLVTYDSFDASGHTLTDTVKHAITINAGTGDLPIDVSSSITLDAGTPSGFRASCDVSAVVTSPDADTLTVGASLSYTAISPTFPGHTPGSPFKGAFTGSFGYNEEEMTTAYIDDVLPVVMQCSDPATGAAMDATGTPTYKVYENGTNTAIDSGSLAKLDDANTTGAYDALITFAAGTGYEVNKGYYVLGFATVNSVVQEGPIGSFVVRAVPATATSNAAAVWATADPGDAVGRATVMGGLLAQIWRYLHNRNVVDNSAGTQTIYGDNSTTVDLSGSITVNDQISARNKLS